MQTNGPRHLRSSTAPLATRLLASLAVLAATLLLGVAWGAGAVRADDKDAHALAQKFAEEAKTDPAPPGTRTADETAQARRREAEAKQEAAQKAAADAKRKSAEAKRRADAARRASLQARIDEQDMLTRARAEAAERAAEERALQAEVDRRDAERAAIAAELETQDLDNRRTPADREADAERLIEAAKAADAARVAMEDARAEEARRLSEKLKLAQERRAAQQAARAAVLQPPPSESNHAAAPSTAPAPAITPPPSGAWAPSRSADVAVPQPEQPSPAAPPSVVAAAPERPFPPVGAAPPELLPAPPSTMPPPATPPPTTVASAVPTAPAAVAPRVAPETRVTVLILMQPGNRGIRRTNKTADPVLCLGPDCYVSKGSEADARHVNRWQALGTFNTLGKRAGACNNSLGCVFRNVDLGAVRAMLQPIDLKIMHHDRRETREVRADPTCDMVGPRLTCAAGIKASDYRLWVVPESVARRAGPAALDAALKAGLPEGGRV